MANFNMALEKLLPREGVFSDDLNDSGGRTCYGISEKNFPKWDGWKIIDSIPVEEIPKSTLIRSLVFTFYHDNFWKPISGDQLLSQDVCESIFDFSVNTGIKTAVRLAQEVLGISNDGIVGQKTIYMLNTCSTKLFIAEYKLKKIDRYCDIVGNSPTQLKWLRGWIIRTLNG